MSNVTNPYSSGAQHTNLGPYQLNQAPTNQLPGSSFKQDANSNNPQQVQGINNQFNHNNQSANNSPAFNHPGMLPPPPPNLQSSPMRHPLKPMVNQSPIPNIQNIPTSNPSPRPIINASNSSPYHPNSQLHQINDNAPPLIPSSQYNQPLMNGPSSFSPKPVNHYPVSSSSFLPPPNGIQTSVSGFNQMPAYPFTSMSSNPISQSNATLGSMPPRMSPLVPGPLINSSTPNIGPMTQPSRSNALNGPSMPGPPYSPMSGQIGPPRNMISGPSSLPTGPMGGLPMRPSTGQPMHPNVASPRPATNAPLQSNIVPRQPPSQPMGYMSNMSGPQSLPMSEMDPSMGQMKKAGPPSGVSAIQGNMQNRYPSMPPMPGNYPQQQQNMTGLSQQMGNLSVTQQGFNQLWGHQMIDLLQCRRILCEYPEDPPEIRLASPFADASNCSHEIFRCTVNRIPDTNSLLQKSRLPLGILIHPFKDLNHLPVIQCTTIVRCRACRTYINPFVYFVDAKRWKCNLCYRVNDLPEEFQYDPVSKTYGDPTRRPEIKSATIEFIAPSEYMLRPPQPAVYLFLFDVSQLARESGYLQVVCDTLNANLEQLPGDARTLIGFICYDVHVHFYMMGEGQTRPKEMTVLDIDEIFLPSPESLLVNLGERRDMIRELISGLPQRHAQPGAPASALGAALQAAYKLMAPTGGRITVFQTCLPTLGPGALQSREDPNARSSKEVTHLNPATDFYKRLALDCSGAQIAVDLFLLSSQYCDLATLSGMSKFSAGSVYHLPLFRATRSWQSAQLTNMFSRYLTRKIGFEAVMRVRCTRGIGIHTFHGNFFVRSTDLLSLPNVSPDAGFGMQLAIEESLSDLQQVCFQAALLYTSSKGERRIRVHTLALPVATTLTDVLHAADQQCIIGLLSKMAVDRCASASMSEAKEAIINVAIDVLSAHRLSQNLPAGHLSSALHAPMSLRLLPLYLLGLLKTKALRTGTSTRLDERVSAMCELKTLPLGQLVRAVYPDLYPIHTLQQYRREHPAACDPPRLQLSAEKIDSDGAYLLDDGESMLVYVCHAVSPAFLSECLGVTAFPQLRDEARELPHLDTDHCHLLHAFVDKLNEDRPHPSSILLIRDNSPSRLQFTERLVDDRVESAFSYYEFLQHIKNQIK